MEGETIFGENVRRRRKGGGRGEGENRLNFRVVHLTDGICEGSNSGDNTPGKD